MKGIDLAKDLIKLDFTLCATKGTAEYLENIKLNVELLIK